MNASLFLVLVALLLGCASAAADDKPLRLRKPMVIPIDSIDEKQETSMNSLTDFELEDEFAEWRELSETSMSMSYSMSF